MPSLLVVVAVAVLMLQYNWTLFLTQLNNEKVDLIVHGKIFYDRVKFRLQLLMLF